jgi:hypothetical protein
LFIFKKLFLILIHQNDLKTLKKILIWSKEKNKKNLIFLKVFLKCKNKYDFNIIIVVLFVIFNII